jgi:AraC-like DNA-binding protein
MSQELKSDFYNSLSYNGPSSLFEHLNNHYYFVKNNAGKFISCSSSLVKLLGFDQEDQIIGKNEFNFFTFDIAMQIQSDDSQVFEEGKSIINRIEFIDNKTNLHQWVSTCKVPLYDQNNKIIGLEGYIHPIVHDEQNPCLELKSVLDDIHRNYKNKFELEELAKMANMSSSSVERTFRKYFHLTPFQYIQKVRVDKACVSLQDLNKNLIDVALETGFCDQSHFTKIFKKQMGVTPSQYRKKYRIWI